MRSFATLAVASLFSVLLAQCAHNDPQTKPQVMIVGVAHLVARADLHNGPVIDWMSPGRQNQIASAMAALAAFRPTTVMVEVPYVREKDLASRYAAYRAGRFALRENEVYQFGFRLAHMANVSAMHAIDTSGGFPFDFDSVKASAARNGQQNVLERAQDFQSPWIRKEDAVLAHGTLAQALYELNSPDALDANAAWYTLVDGIGGGTDFAGANLAAYWYARNLHILANIRRYATSPNDRIVVFIGAGHAALLRHFLDLAPDMQSVDPRTYLR